MTFPNIAAARLGGAIGRTRRLALGLSGNAQKSSLDGQRVQGWTALVGAVVQRAMLDAAGAVDYVSESSPYGVQYRANLQADALAFLAGDGLEQWVDSAFGDAAEIRRRLAQQLPALRELIEAGRSTMSLSSLAAPSLAETNQTSLA